MRSLRQQDRREASQTQTERGAAEQKERKGLKLIIMEDESHI